MSYLLFLLLQPTLVGGNLEARGAATDIERQIVQGVEEPFWAGYAVPKIAGRNDGCNGVVHLETGQGDGRSEEGSDPGELILLYRIAEGKVDEIRTASMGCRIDASNRTVYWWSGVGTEGSLRLLSRLVREDPFSENAEGALHAIALHRGPRADELLGSFASGEWPFELREDAVFWLGAARGPRGLEILSTLVESPVEPPLRQKIAFALHVSEAPGATSELIELARRDADPNVREQALFWLAQEAGEQASQTIAEAVQEDPELAVKEKAVFCLSQLPPDEGVPLLVEVAETHPSVEIREKAFFWLGQSGDPRALALFERVLLVR